MHRKSRHRCLNGHIHSILNVYIACDGLMHWQRTTVFVSVHEPPYALRFRSVCLTCPTHPLRTPKTSRCRTYKYVRTHLNYIIPADVCSSIGLLHISGIDASVSNNAYPLSPTPSNEVQCTCHVCLLSSPARLHNPKERKKHSKMKSKKTTYIRI